MEQMNGSVFSGVVRTAVSDGLLKPPGLVSAAVLLLFSVGVALFYPVFGAALIIAAVFIFISETVILSRSKRPERYPYGLKSAGLFYLLYGILSAVSAAGEILGLNEKLPTEKIQKAIPFSFAANCRDKGLSHSVIVFTALCICSVVTAVYFLYLSKKTVCNLIPKRAAVPCAVSIIAVVILVADAVLKTGLLPEAVYTFLGMSRKGTDAVSVAEAVTVILAAAGLLLNFIRLCIINIKIRKMKNAFCGKI